MLLADVEMLLETHLRRNKVKWINQSRKSEEYLVNGIPDQLKQVFLNISLNAIEAMQPDGGSITVSTKLAKEEEQIGIKFSDTGPGISPEVMKFIFDPFFTTKESGMGLGLSICYDITQNHNGYISIDNNEETGATFTIWLPLSTSGNAIPLTAGE
jgi:signal transduction histidine kinase